MLSRLARASRALQEAACIARSCGRGTVAGSHPARHRPAVWIGGGRRAFSGHQAWRQEATAAIEHDVAEPLPPPPKRKPHPALSLPTACPGCGALSQTISRSEPGFYDLRKTRSRQRKQVATAEDAVFRASSLASSGTEPRARSSISPEIPICDRCHELRYHNRGTPIIHPSVASIQAIVEESPHKHNHIYHVLDAADFPMSLIPNLQSALNLPRLRTRNRRSKTIRYLRGRVAEVSFIITRSDLLAPKKEQVDSLMPYLQEVLRDALGRTGKKVRLGNVRCVSAQRGWWTRQVKEEIWERGGAGWMVGKVNAGKSALVEAVFPKGRVRGKEVDEEELGGKAEEAAGRVAATLPAHEGPEEGEALQKFEPFQETELTLDPDRAALEDPDEEPFATEDEALELLPPAPALTAYPPMPLQSSLPGTTASPIRIPFGNRKGEIIDLPGIARTNLPDYVKPEHHQDLVMTSRIVPDQHVIKPGQSLLLGGVIRITPSFSGIDAANLLAYPFVPPAFSPHVTGTHKAIAIQTGVHSLASKDREGQAYAGTIESVATEDAKRAIASAGTYKLEWNVTKRRSGPLTDPAAGKRKTDSLPFIVYSADMLIESVGWVELVCQVRRRSESLLSVNALAELEMEGRRDGVPEVEIFSPQGKFVGCRRPMGAWLLGGRKREAVHKRRGRPRASIGLQRRREGGRASRPAD